MTILFIMSISFFATLVRSTFGFGESLIAVPLLILFLPIGVSVPLSVLLSILIALIVVIQDHSKVQFQSAKWLIFYALPGIPVGLMLLFFASVFWIKLLLGILLVVYSLYSLFGKQTLSNVSSDRAWLFVCGFFSGVFGGAYGINGPALVVYGKLRGWSANQFRATLQAYFFVASSASIIGYGYKGLITQQVLTHFSYAAPAAIPAIFFGRYLNNKLESKDFYQYVYIGLLTMGAFLIIHTSYQ
ncbi:sulfite exporter TauE/SafE family protein [Dyadobacter aurulentus]|uniref:sulfite exporter TauE/SafE family protein n=1 Tax=Dyadobacter sp. UC 10 TaxID=2605428 RepID=UPI001CEDEAF6|nr:sulfite exporter TauE/SafE family protein [Dyadobacter sp. UC 10]